MFYLIKFINSFRVESLFKNNPVNALVVVAEFCFWTPRICMHMWEHSNTTATPFGFNVLCRQSRISKVRRSCTWSLLEKESTTRGILLRPTILPFGMYAMCAFPKKAKHGVRTTNKFQCPLQVPFLNILREIWLALQYRQD